MKIIKTIFAALSVAALVASCDKAEPTSIYRIEILSPATGEIPVRYLYANSGSDSLKFVSYCPWKIELKGGDNSFVTINGKQEGVKNVIVKYGVDFAENTTGKSRYANYQIIDSEDASRARATFQYVQYATRQDGSLGTAAEVKNISGSDGSNIDITYDRQHRPLTISMQAGQMKRTMEFTYNDIDGIVTAKQTEYEFAYRDTVFKFNNVELKGTIADRYFPNQNSYIYQPRMLMNMESGDVTMTNTALGIMVSAKQTMGYKAFANNGYEYSYANGFMVNNTIGDKFVQAYGFYYNSKGSLEPDGLHTADSIGVERIYSDHSHKAEMYKLEYSSVDNRKTSVDVNQLIEGVENCDPYMLLSFYKLARQTSVISKATGNKGTAYTITTTTNADGSVKTMQVANGNGGAITYTFGY